MPVTDREARLEARVREIEDERGRRGRSAAARRYEDVRESYLDLTGRKVDEAARLLSGVVRAGMEGFRVITESASVFADDVLERSIPEPDESSSDVVRRLPSDLTSGLTRKIDRSLDAPGRKIERFHRSYTVEEGGRPTRLRRARRGLPRREPATEDPRRWSRRELYDRAAELGIEDFREMSREDLADAIEREQRGYEEWSTAELYRRALDLDIAGREDMNREQLADAIRRRERRAAPARTEIERIREAGDDLEALSRQELVERAEAIGIESRGSSAEQLRRAIREHKPALEDMSRQELYELARRYEVPNRSQMSREELIAAIRAHEGEKENEKPKAS